MDLKVAVIQAIPNYKQDSANPKERSRRKEKPASFKDVLKKALKQ
ncbi:MAG: hypothetical protein K0R55_2576 [Sporomusa sp.]|jgi:flagellar biogenesis protein FliO|nr:hypothetical protein [Sporomusa sp.]